MGYSIVFAKAAKRQFDKLPPQAQKRLGTVISQLAEDPRPAGVTKLSGEERLYRVRTGDYRAVYQIKDARLLVLVVRVGHRREVYR